MIKPKVSRGKKPKVKAKTKPAVFTGRTIFIEPKDKSEKSLSLAKEIRDKLNTRVKLFEKEKKIFEELFKPTKIFETATLKEQKAKKSIDDLFVEYLGDLKVKLKPVVQSQDIKQGHGLFSYKNRHKLKDIFEFPAHYLQHQDKDNLDYVVTGYNDVIALAVACGVMPKDLFDMLCNYIKSSKTKLKRDKVTQNYMAVCQVVEYFRQETKKAKSRGFKKYSFKQLANSKFFKDWCKTYDVYLGEGSKRPENRVAEIWKTFEKIADAQAYKSYKKADLEVQGDLKYLQAEAEAGNETAIKKLKELDRLPK